MFSMPRHVDEENNEYPASAEYPVLTKQKKKRFISQHSRGAVSTQKKIESLGHILILFS